MMSVCVVVLTSGTVPQNIAAFVCAILSRALRSILKAHSSVEDKDKEERNARATHETLRAHFKDLAGRCDKSFDTILLALGVGDLNP